MAKAITLLEFASSKTLTRLLVKERAKCRKRNRGDKKKHLDKECDIDNLPMRKMLSRMMPPRHTWVRPSKRDRLPNGAADTSKNTEKALLLTIDRDRKLSNSKGQSFAYLQELDAFIARIRKLLATGEIKFDSPQLMPVPKNDKIAVGGVTNVTCRPIVVYKRLEDKIILALVSRYLTSTYTSSRLSLPWLSNIDYDAWEKEDPDSFLALSCAEFNAFNAIDIMEDMIGTKIYYMNLREE